MLFFMFGSKSSLLESASHLSMLRMDAASQQMQSVMYMANFFDRITFCLLGACSLALRVSPAVTRLTIYCWLHIIHTQPIRPGNTASNLKIICSVQTLIARDSVVTFERRSELT